MEDISYKTNTKENGLFKFVTQRKFISSMILCLIFFLIYFIINSFHIYTGGDDPGIYRLISNGEIGISFVGYFFAGLIYLLNPIFSAINLNIYYIIHDIICFFSLSIINYLFLYKLGAKKGLFLSAVFNTVFFSFFLITIQFTATSIVAGTAGILCIINGCVFEKRGRIKWLQIAGGGCLALLASQVRFSPVISLAAVTAAFSFSVFLTDFIKNKKEEGLKDAFFKSLKRYFKAALALIVTAVIIFGVNTISDKMKYNDSNYKEFMEYNAALSEVNDYRIANFFANKDFYYGIGINTFTETNILKRWCVDDDFFTIDKLKTIADYSKEHAYDGAGSKSSFKVLFRLISDGVMEHTKSGLIILDVFLIIVVVFGLWILWMLKRKKFYTVFPIVLFTAMWGILLATTGGITASRDNCNLLILPIAIFTLYVSVFYNKNQQIITLFLSIAVIILYIYLYLSRIHFNAALCFYLPAYVMMIYSLNSDNLKQLEFKKHPKFLIRLCSIILAVTSLCTGALIFTNNSYVEYPSDYDKVEEYINSHKDNIFLEDGIYRTRNNFNAFVKPIYQKNVVSFGGWDKKSRTYKESLKSHGIKHLFRDAVDSNIIVIFFNYFQDKKMLNSKIGDFQIYYNEHYAPKGKVISFKKVKSFDRYFMYKIVSEKIKKSK